MRNDVERFLARFARFGAEPSVATYLALFDPAATLFDSGMPRPLRVPEIPEHIAGILALAQGFRMTPERWRFREPTLFVEASNRATLAGAPIEWPSIYCIDLAGDRVIRGRRYYDRRPLFARLSPEIGRLPAFEPDPMPVGAPPPAEPLAIGALRRRIPDVAAKLASWAGDDALLLREWELHGTLAGRPLRFGAADRVDLAGGRVASSGAYFDSLVLTGA